MIRCPHPADGMSYDMSVQAVHRSGHTHHHYIIIRWGEHQCRWGGWLAPYWTPLCAGLHDYPLAFMTTP